MTHDNGGAQPQHGQPQYGEPQQYGQPAAQPQYGQPQPQHGQAQQYGQAQYGQTAPVQDAPREQTLAGGYGAPATVTYAAQQSWQGYGAYQPAAVQVSAPAAQMAAPGQLPWGVRTKRPVVLEILVVVFGGLLASAFLVLMAFVTSGTTVVVAVLLALVPLATLVLAILWIDRWEPEPRFLLIAAFLWGGGVAVAVASLLNSVVGVALGSALAPSMDPVIMPAVFGAPVVEEAMKGLGILLIFLIRRREFNGPVDGVVYAAVVATGFAIVEDVQYFALNDDALGFVFVMRAILSPFGHLIYSLPMGLALGFASRMRSRAAWVWMFPIGYLMGVGLHAAWNGAASHASTLGGIVLLFVLLNWVPLALFTALVVWLRRREATVIAMRLRDYVPSGWISEIEVSNLSSMRANRAARAWAKRFGPQVHKAMRDYQRSAVGLAYARQDLYTGHAGNRARVDEMQMLTRMAQARSQVMAATAPRPAY